MLDVHHYLRLGTGNVGDRLAARGVQEAVQRHFGPCRFTEIPANERYRGPEPVGLCSLNVERSNREADLVVIGGSNLLEARKPRRDSSAPGWGVIVDLQALTRLRKPLLLLGMGAGSSFRKPIRRYSKTAADELRALHQLAFGAAVRDANTARMLIRLGVSACPTTCPTAMLTSQPIGASPEGPIIVAFPPARIARRMGGLRFMKLAANYLGWLHSQQIETLATLHDAADRPWAERLLPRGTTIFHSDDVEPVVARYQNCRGVVGFRYQATMLALGLGKPVVPVALDGRGAAMIDSWSAAPFSIAPFRLGQLARLRRLTPAMLSASSELHEHFNLQKQRHRARFEAFLAGAAARFKLQGGRPRRAA